MLSNLFILLLIITACSDTESLEKTITPEQEKYWYAGDAELTSYELKQARYGEIREGKAVLVFVTEHFSTNTWSKADQPTSKDKSVLKLNFTKKFNTGIYPYSMMTSTFFPFENGENSLKVTSTSQEWCGHTYMELRNKRQFEINTASYFEGESGQKSVKKSLLEDDIWSMIRLKPNDLPEGEKTVIPSFFYLRLTHQATKDYQCILTKSRLNDSTSIYEIKYPSLDRTLIINYQTVFPHQILSWEETYMDGFGNNRKKLTTTGKKIKTLKTDYWAKHRIKDEPLRKELGLEDK